MPTGSSISEHAIIQFTGLVHTRVQQMVSRLSPYSEFMKLKGKAAAYDGIGTVELEEVMGRNAAVEFGDIEHWRRKIVRRRFAATLPIDDNDVEQMLTDPKSTYAAALAKAANRVRDRVIIDAMFANVQTGEDFATTLTPSQDGVITVDATGGLTYEKMLEINENFIDNEVGNDMDVPFVMGVTGNEHTDLMSEVELTSGDFSREYVIDKGSVSKALGINVVKFAANGAGGANPMLPVVSGTRTSFCMAKGAVVVGVAREWSIKIEDRSDLYDTRQVKITGVLGAVRTEGKLIQKIETTAS